MSYVLPPPPQASVAVAGSTDRFPVRRVFCVGRNYAAHAREMGKDPDREPPFFFMKPSDAVVDSGSTLPYPPQTKELHYEMEMVVALAKGGRNIAREKALDHVFGYACGLDLTRRDLQQQAKDMGRPWDFGKGFDRSAPCAPIHRAAEVGHPEKGRIWLSVNGTVKQDGDLSELIWPIADIIAILSQSMRLEPGDLIFSGTPAGVGAVKPGDKLTGGVAGLGDIAITIGQPER
ncbi:MAG: fumarylacetoacetate hydrolase family protein [Hyphomicrobiales bacterium]|nr:fumarylacetoacetate hydrolase family protein [Hyphomicrobiales bacterium]